MIIIIIITISQGSPDTSPCKAIKVGKTFELRISAR